MGSLPKTLSDRIMDVTPLNPPAASPSFGPRTGLPNSFMGMPLNPPAALSLNPFLVLSLIPLVALSLTPPAVLSLNPFVVLSLIPFVVSPSNHARGAVE